MIKSAVTTLEYNILKSYRCSFCIPHLWTFLDSYLTLLSNLASQKTGIFYFHVSKENYQNLKNLQARSVLIDSLDTMSKATTMISRLSIQMACF